MNPTSTVRRRVSRRLTGWAFVLPFTACLGVFGVAPVVYAIYISFQVTPVIGDSYFSLVDNYAAVLSDYRLPVATGNVLLYLVIWLPSMLVVVFAIALLLDAKRTRFAALTRFVTYLPGAVTGSAAAILWVFMFTPSFSPFGPIISSFADSSGSIINNHSLPLLLSILAIAIGGGGWIVLLFGALTAIPKDIIEAATIDGVNPWQLVWNIKLPLIRSYFAFILIVSFAGGFQVFVEPQIMATASSKVSAQWSINQIVFAYASSDSNYGRASALAVLLLVICVALAVLVVTRTNFYSTGRDDA